MWYCILKAVNLSPCAVESTTTRSSLPITPRASSFFSTASATPVCGQLNSPVASASATASTSSCSVACSTIPAKRFKVATARG